MTMQSLSLQDDHRHDLEPGAHEAFYFVFTSPRGEFFGFLRTLWSNDSVLEIVALYSGGRVWRHQQRVPRPDGLPAEVASGSKLALTCQEPWQRWHCSSHTTVEAADGQDTLPLELELDFIAANAPASYVVGPYTQAQQDGRMEGQVRLGEQEWNGAMLCYRDHSWGQRQMGKPDGWTIACLPGVFYLFSVEQQGRTFCLGRVFTPDAAPAKEATVVAIDGGWRISDPTSGLGEHYATRMTEPLVAYLGVSGEESIRNEPAEGDLYRDELGPATFISPRHQKFVGFIEHARRL